VYIKIPVQFPKEENLLFSPFSLDYREKIFTKIFQFIRKIRGGFKREKKNCIFNEKKNKTKQKQKGETIKCR
jgi:hypothetical protein